LSCAACPLEGAKISSRPVGLEYLDELAYLEYLNLDRTQVSDAGMSVIEQFHGFERLHWTDAQVSEEGLIAIRHAQPDFWFIG
jgi:hypothetical protein